MSVGRWDGGTLVVDTTDIDYPHFDGRGIPLARGARVEERFTMNADGSRLDYTMKVTDPATFTEPVTLDEAVGVAARRASAAIRLPQMSNRWPR